MKIDGLSFSYSNIFSRKATIQATFFQNSIDKKAKIYYYEIVDFWAFAKLVRQRTLNPQFTGSSPVCPINTS
ncbi:hypothetical protein FC19_GL001238 [Liquorilactobacillus aquaticus DSM 21051]|uniref:Uncharacterized protein n=1 Tax=Liquorilactobacillus aquaticus DSM 21051 TaxID=1423725 RepID=A0A0R2CW29_9LACO|nr:hypothetical protein FC19_GL001238 [Liquorilactobacillus aquaticus DSM 21051]